MISLLNFQLSPKSVRQGTTSVTLSYDAMATTSGDNDVKLVFNVDPKDDNIFIVDDTGNQVKSLTYTQTFPTDAQHNLTKVIKIKIVSTPPAEVLSPVSLSAKNVDNTSAAGPLYKTIAYY